MKLFTLKWSVWGFPWQSSGGQSSSSPKTLSSFSYPGCAGFNPWSGNCPWPKTQNIKKKEEEEEDFPGGTVDKNLPAIAGKTGSIPGPGRFHTLRGN